MVQNYRDNRILWIDWAKSIGMFLVILGHCHIRESEQIVTQYIYSFHMMLFFFLSGILCRRDLSLTSIKKDIRYLIFPYLVYGLIGISIICMFFDRIKLKFVMMTSYGSLVSLGLHAIPLTILHYYVPILLGFEPSTYSVCLAIIFSSLTYCFCYISILIIDKECPLIFGLKGIRNRQVFHGYVL